VTTASAKYSDLAHLDALTGGAFTAATAGERAARIREWLLSEPGLDQMQEVFRELSTKDKGAAKPLREKLDEIKRSKGQEAIAAEWASKAQALLDTPKLNVADAMAWQRDAAKAGAPLSKEPLATRKALLADRVKVIEDLQHRVQVQREAAVLLAQRIEVLSTKAWRDAQLAWDSLRADIDHWQSQAQGLQSDSNWASVDAKFPPLLEASRNQLPVVWEAFNSALAQAVAAAEDPAADLPPVPVWADELRAARGLAQEAAAPPKKPRVDPEVRQHAVASVREVLAKLEQEISQGHGKASAGAALALRQALKEFGRLIDDKLEAQVQAALAAAGELEGWQRWRADQIREELVTKAQALLQRPPGQAMGGRKIQEALRNLRDQWKLTDQGGVPNHGLWKRFDEACNEAHKVVEVWLEKIKSEAAENRAQRLALLAELQAWALENPSAKDDDWKGFARLLQQFADRWRDAGHLSEKAFAELQPLWKAAISAAAAPLELMQKQSLAQREALIAEAQLLAGAPILQIDALRGLQQRWQAEAHAVPIDRRQEQKLWDAFRKPIDEAFNRKTAEREKIQGASSERDRAVLAASKALQAANASADAQAIRSAMQALEAALNAQEMQTKNATEPAASAPPVLASSALSDAAAATQDPATLSDPAQAGETVVSPVEPIIEKPVVRKAVVAVRGDDRPGMKKAEPAGMGHHARAGQGRAGASRDSAAGKSFGRDARGSNDRGPRATQNGSLPPRLGDAAFRAQRDALEQAQTHLRKLAAQSHGESLNQLLLAWQNRDATLVPSVQALGARVNTAVRTAWSNALATAAGANGSEALLRLEMAAEVPTPASDLDARRALQLKLLTRRHDPSPSQTWAQDVSQVLRSPFDESTVRRLQGALKVLLRN
jgi:ATP-dependent RNA helicase SUPV3L1/SUV3